MKDPKWGSMRTVPIPISVYESCQEVAASNPWNNEFVFYSEIFRDKPIERRLVNESFNDACKKIGIKNREERNISFHSWRHWYDTIIAGCLPGEVRRRLTGHSTEDMDKRYIHFTDEHKVMLD